MYAIIETGGKQYRVNVGDVVSLERLSGEVGSTITLDKVLLVGGRADSSVLVGTPYLTQASTLLEIVGQTRGEKLLTIKYKRRKGYRRTIGHRQEHTRVLVTKITDGKGQSIEVDSKKRSESLMKASVKTSTRALTRKPKQEAYASPKAAAAPKAKKTASAAKKTTTAQSKPRTKKKQ